MPQPHTVPSLLSASVKALPAATAIAPLKAPPAACCTCVGEDRSVVVPSPSCPWSLRPHAQTVPSERTATLRRPVLSAAIATSRPIRALTGSELLVVVPSPSWPRSFRPQERTFVEMANVRETPVAACQVPPPAWTAVTVQGPLPVRWTVARLTVQLPAALNDTRRADDALAKIVKSASPSALSARAGKVIVCARLPGLRIANVVLPPAATVLAPVMPVAWTGRCRSVEVPSPRLPWPL